MRDRRPTAMRVSASLVVLGLGLIAFQVAFSDGAMPRIAPLPIGMVPVTAGLVSLLLGLVLGLAVGDVLYRTATMLAWAGSAGIFDGTLLFTTGGPGPRPALSGNDIAVFGGAAMWVVALVLGALAIWRTSRDRTSARP